MNKNSKHELRETYDLIKHDRYYPTEVPDFKEKLESLENACRALDVKLLKLLAMAVKLDDIDFFCKASTNLEDTSVPSLNTMRTLYYPPIENAELGVSRCSEHSDYGILTLLFQDSIGGLEVHHIKTKPSNRKIVKNN